MPCLQGTPFWQTSITLSGKIWPKITWCIGSVRNIENWHQMLPRFSQIMCYITPCLAYKMSVAQNHCCIKVFHTFVRKNILGSVPYQINGFGQWLMWHWPSQNHALPSVNVTCILKLYQAYTTYNKGKHGAINFFKLTSDIKKLIFLEHYWCLEIQKYPK